MPTLQNTLWRHKFPPPLGTSWGLSSRKLLCYSIILDYGNIVGHGSWALPIRCITERGGMERDSHNPLCQPKMWWWRGLYGVFTRSYQTVPFGLGWPLWNTLLSSFRTLLFNSQNKTLTEQHALSKNMLKQNKCASFQRVTMNQPNSDGKTGAWRYMDAILILSWDQISSGILGIAILWYGMSVVFCWF